MNPYIYKVILIIVIFISIYLTGRLLMKGFLHEIERYLMKKFNKSKTEKDGTEKKE